MTRLLVAGVGNVLRGDDGFGPAVVERLDDLPPGTRVVETGIGGVALVQELLEGWDGLVLVDAVDQGEAPGTLFVIEPEVAEFAHVPDVHLAVPGRVLSLARGLGVLPDRVVIVGCQPAKVDDLIEGLSPPVRRALPVAMRKVRELLEAWAAEEDAVRA